VNPTRVNVTYGDREHLVESGTRVDEFLRRVDGEISDTVLAALVNRRQVMLDFPLRGAADLELVSYGSREGEAVYKRSVCLMLHEAAARRYPNARLIVGQSLGNSYHYQVRGEHPSMANMAKVLLAEMRSLRDQALPFLREGMTVEEIEILFSRSGRQDTLDLLDTRRSSTVHTLRCGSFVDIAHGPAAPNTGCLPTFGLEPYGDGLVLLFPRRTDRSRLPPFKPREKLYRTAVEARSWQELLGVHHVGQLNRICIDGEVRHLIRVGEGLHEKKIAAIADEILQRSPEIRLVTVAGPSSSGKTTFVRRLGIQLRVNGIQPVALSLDDYYVDREKTPVDEDGNLDFEALEAIDLGLFHAHLDDLLRSREVRTPHYDFVTGRRVPESQWKTLRLEPDQVLVIEGIHGLNGRLTESVPEALRFRVFVSALSQLAIDDHNRIFTSDARLIRRIVRDRLFRGFTAERTLGLWDRVRRGEGRWIYPFQEAADVMFNSSLPYEPAVLRVWAERFLLQVPRSSPTYAEAYRLLKFLSLFVSVFPDEVPQTSILREFIGGSSFRK
jgi:uridine kinase